MIAMSFDFLKTICKAECLNKCLLVNKHCNEDVCPIFSDYSKHIYYFNNTSDNINYEKCADDIEKLMMYRGESWEQFQLIEILKKHFGNH